MHPGILMRTWALARETSSRLILIALHVQILIVIVVWFCLAVLAHYPALVVIVYTCPQPFPSALLFPVTVYFSSCCSRSDLLSTENVSQIVLE